MWLLAALGAVVVLAAIATVLVILRPKPRALPILAGKLPPKTMVIAQSRLDWDESNPKRPDEFVTSALAEAVCGGRDVAGALTLARGKPVKQLLTLGVLDLVNTADVRAGLRCGDEVRKTLLDPTFVRIAFDDPEHIEIVALQSSLAQLPADRGFTRHTFSGMAGSCLHKVGAKTECPDGDPAGFHDGQTWFVGTTVAVEAFARAYTTAHTELTTTVDTLNRVIGETDRADIVGLEAKPEHIAWMGPCEAVAPVEAREAFLKACFPKEDRLLDSIVSKVRGVAVQRDVLSRASTYRYVFVLVPRDPDSAKSLEADVTDLARDWRAQFENNGADMDKLVREKSTYVHDDFWRAAFDPFTRAMKGMKVTRSGGVVRLVIETPLRPEEQKALREFEDTRTDDQRALGRVVGALVDGKPPTEKDLSSFVDPVVVKWMVSPKATSDDCKRLREHFKTVTESVPIEQFGLKFKQEKRFEDSACLEHVLPTAAKDCLMSATALQGIASCWIPANVHAAVAAGRVEGQWVLGTAEPDDPTAAGLKLEIRSGMIAVAFPDGTLTTYGSHEIASEDGDAFTMSLPLRSARGTPMTIDGEVSDELVLRVAKKEKWTFKRAKFDVLIGPTGAPALAADTCTWVGMFAACKPVQK